MQNGTYMRTHLTWEEIEKYIDTSDLTEEYLLWMEQVSEHIDACEICQKRIQKAAIIEGALEEDNFSQMLELAQHEEEIRRNILICKLYQMSQDDNTREELQQTMMQIIQKMQQQAVQAYILQAVAMQKRAGVSRGEEYFAKREDGLEISYKDSLLQVCFIKDSSKNYLAVLNQDGKAPQIAEAVWTEEKDCFVAEFEIEESLTEFEIYIVEN